MNDILRPCPGALISLLNEVTDLLTPLESVRKILCFGSLARNTWDCWSDIDLIAVTDTRPQFVEILERLQTTKPILHRNHFVAHVEPCGGHILGIVFQGVSVFHCLDLNLLTYQEYQTVGALARFGITKELYNAGPSPVIHQRLPIDVSSELEDRDEARIKVGVHFTKKAAKKVLRGEPFFEDLLRHAIYLKQVMADYSTDLVIADRHIGRLAQSYIEIADLLLQTRE